MSEATFEIPLDDNSITEASFDRNKIREAAQNALAPEPEQTDFEKFEVPDGFVADFNKITRRWRRDWTSLDSRVINLQELVMLELPNDAPEEKQRELALAKADARTEMDDIIDLREMLMRSVIKQIPQEWCTDDCPADVDWAQEGALLDYVYDRHGSDIIWSITKLLSEGPKG